MPESDTVLTDSFGRRIEYLRLSVTDRCDLRCGYCLPKHYRGASEPREWLDPDEIEHLVGAFAALGVKRVRLTGGEPLVRRALPEIARRIGALPGIADLSISTNATRLDRHAEGLHEAGVSRVNVSLDSLDPVRFAELTGGGKLDKVLRGLDAAARAGLRPVKVNTVLMGGVNDDEAEALLDYCAERGFTLRFIEPMPMGDTGRGATDHHVDLDDIRLRLARSRDLIPELDVGDGGPARYYRVQGGVTSVGFITPMSRHFCDSCNRVRLGPDGRLYPCLGTEHSVDLGGLVRGGAGRGELMDAVRAAIQLKPERHHFNEEGGQVIRFMGVTGG